LHLLFRHLFLTKVSHSSFHAYLISEIEMAFSGRRGRGYASRGGYAWRANRPSNTLESRSPPLGDLLQTRTIEELKKGSSDFQASAVIRDSNFVASYNWLEGNDKKATLLIPGTDTGPAYSTISVANHED
jgi:hypothetical protein